MSDIKGKYDINYNKYEILVSKLIGVYGITGQQLVLVQKAIRPLILAAYDEGYNRSKQDKMEEIGDEKTLHPNEKG